MNCCGNLAVARKAGKDLHADLNKFQAAKRTAIQARARFEHHRRALVLRLPDRAESRNEVEQTKATRLLVSFVFVFVAALPSVRVNV